MLRSSLFWDNTRRRVVIVYRRFGTTCRSHLHGSNVRVGKQRKKKTREVGTDTLSRNVGKQLPHDAAYYPRRTQISALILFLCQFSNFLSAADESLCWLHDSVCALAWDAERAQLNYAKKLRAEARNVLPIEECFHTDTSQTMRDGKQSAGIDDGPGDDPRKG
jgi:hypothetical protein